MKSNIYILDKNQKKILEVWIITLVLCYKVNLSCLEDDLQIAMGYSNSILYAWQNSRLQSLSSNQFKFHHYLYNVTIPENSIGKTYVTSVPHEDLMGINYKRGAEVRYRIVSGDRDKLFKAEERIVGNIAFLTIRTRTSNVVLNREKTDEYFLKVKAIIHFMNKNYESETTVHVKVLDTNDLSPLFYPSEYFATVAEDMPLHKSILKVTAEDADLGINGEIYYSFLQDNEYFAIHPTSGIINLIRQLKYTEHVHFELTVLANDRGAAINHSNHQASKAKVSFIVKQVNLYDPEIHLKALAGISANSSSFVYAIVKVSDKDVGLHGELNKLEIVDGDPNGNFFITKSETVDEYYVSIHKFAKLKNAPYIYNLTLRAEDKGVPVRSSLKELPVKMFSESGTAPVFTKPLYEVTIPETSPCNTPVIRLKVISPDFRKHALVFLEIVGGNEGGEFRINPDSGMLYTQKNLDAENKSFYTLTVSAIDQANVGVRKQSSAKVKINIQDMNDNDPEFDNVTKTVQINENEPPGTYVTKIKAKDKDSGENSYLSYSIANLNDVPFEIDPFTGVIRTTKLIDYETMQRKYELRVRASDWGLPYRRQTEVEFLIEINDINDNRPQFERVSCFGKVVRNVPVGTDLFTFSAVDFDTGEFVTYRLNSGNEDNCFNLDSITGVLSVGCDLKDVGVAYRTISVSSTDGIHFSDEASISITLVSESSYGEFVETDPLKSYSSFECRETGVARKLAEILASAELNNNGLQHDILKNDLSLKPSRYGNNLHKPEFLDFPQELKINESVQLGDTIFWIKAKDRDLGYNGKLMFVISDGDNDSVFRIDPDTGELQVIGYIDRERQNEYILNITVYDLGSPQKSVSKMIPVIVLDCNDNPPIFQNPLATIRVSESVPNATLIYCMNASDADIGKNADISYLIATETNDFHINKSTGCIYSSGGLDREKQEKYNLHVICKDFGIPSLTAEAIINIYIDDINDNSPIFGVSEFIFKVREDVPSGTIVASLEAKDMDLGVNGEIYFLLREENVDYSNFKIDKHTGLIRTQSYLDYETQQIHNLIVSAVDRGTPSLTTEMPIIIEIIDVNENRFGPEFRDFVYVGSIKENKPKGSFVLNVTAVDLDAEGPNSRLSYALVGGNGMGLFSVTNLGSIHTLSRLDAETQNNYWLTLCAQDEAVVPMSSCVQVYVEVQNENDNVPLTENPIYYTAVSEGSPVKTPILILKAFDKDVDESQKITYQITSGNPEGFFDIDSATGTLTTTERKLDRENQAEHILEVLVSDNGSPPLFSSCKIIIDVEDINDHTPEFDQRFYKIQIHSRIAINESIYQVQAFDGDIGENGRIFYSIKSGKGKNKFRIDSHTGIIYVVRLFESETEYELIIRAEDNGNPKRSQTARLNILIIRIKENSPNPPRIKTVDNVIDVTESDRPGFLVALIQASDVDKDSLWYNITDGNIDDVFYIGRDNGNILLSKSLDRETISEYNITICVTDGTYAIQTHLYVHVVDTNDNRPEFSKSVYYVNVSENIQEESVIMQLSATDKDEDKKIFYTLHAAEDPKSLSLFRIDTISGNIIVTERLDYERNIQHILIVSAKDQGTPSKRNYAKVVVNVYDHNDHAPVFVSKIIQRYIPEGAAIGSKIVKLLAIDRDYGANAEIKYSIISGNIGNTFAIDAALGLITLAQSLDINEMQEYILQIKATDCGNPPLSSQIPVHIIVQMSESDPPKFFSDKSVMEVYENTAIGSFIKRIEARSMSSVSYEILNGNENSTFHISPSTGIIFLSDRIDYESQRLYNLTVKATNMASVSSNHLVHIHVLDVNDNAPYFLQKEYFGEISEAADLNAFVQISNKTNSSSSALFLKTLDVDSGINGMTEFKIIDEIARTYFKIDTPTGTIRLLKQVDYEDRKEFKFTVVAYDLGKPRLYSKELANVKISIINANDCPPIFEKNEIYVDLYQPTYPDIIVARVNASDADMDKNISIRYDIVDGNEHGGFHIDYLSGIITTRKIEYLNNNYELHVRASDGLFSAISVVKINVKNTEITDFRFQKPKYEFTTPENSTKVVVIGLVNVVGNPLCDYVEYQILNAINFFEVGKTSGVIKTSGFSFDRERKDKYELIIQATLHSSKDVVIKRASTQATISISDINDNCPIFVNLPYYATVSADDIKGSTIMSIKAVDLDSSENGEVRYEMKRGNGELFKVDRKSGEVILKQRIDTQNSNYELLIAAYDGGVIPCSTETTANIKVVDKSMPHFVAQFFPIVVKENADISSALPVPIKAESLISRKLIYTISEGNTDELFEIDYRTGVLYIVGNLDHEKKRDHEFIVRSTDSVSGIYAEVPVSVKVEDINDCYPELETDNYNISIPENFVPSTYILKINATDRDSSANGELSYFIESVNGRNDSDIFYISIENGSLFLKKPLDYEECPLYHLIVDVRDHGIPFLSSKANIWAKVEDVNDNAPTFVEPFFSTKLSIAAERGHFVTITKAYDLDWLDNDRLVYKIISGNDLQTYSIDKTKGIIRVQNKQHLTDNHQVLLNVSVTDGVHSSFARVKVTLQPENQHGPLFSQLIYRASIKENLLPGIHIITLQASDADFGKYSIIEFEISSNDMKEFFEIDRLSGSVISKISFDYETRKHYDILIKAADRGKKIAFCTLRIDIIDENDNYPKFHIDQYKALVKCNTQLNATILRIGAVDIDGNENGLITYKIDTSTLNPAYRNMFLINETSGFLVVTKSLLNLSNEVIEFFVRAEDNGVPSLHSDVAVLVQILNADIVVPQFEKTMIKLNVLESTPPGSILTVLKISGNYSMKFSLSKDADAFSVNENGEVVLMQRLDREVTDSHHIIAATETSTTPILFAYIDIFINVQDENDNYPKFDRTFYLEEISENIEKFTSVIKITATDADAGANGDVRYYLDSANKLISNFFDIDLYSGWITSLTNLDRELQSEYSFDVLATDNTHVSRVPVIIKIGDYNDNPAKFKNSTYEISVLENAIPGTILTHFLLSDIDSEKTDHNFFIASGDEFSQFQIERTGELFVARSLDREMKSMYSLELVATDGLFLTTSTVLVRVKDVNDNMPSCIRPRYNITINESILVGTILERIVAVDNDESSIEDLKYYLSGDNSEDFFIEKDSGILRIAKSIDRERCPSYKLYVHAQDGPELLRECISEVLLTIRDVNDNKPEFLMTQYIISVPENAAPNTLVAKVHANDKDAGLNRKVIYSFVEESEHFSISPSTGIIKLLQSLDRESVSVFNITVKAEDHGVPRLHSFTNVLINVLDINDNPPEFDTTTYNTFLLENSTKNTEVLKVFATSKDIGVNAEISYFIIGGNEQKCFDINSKNGSIFVQSILDYEKTRSYFLTIQAVDGGTPPLSNLAFVNISLIDINDNQPTFLQNTYRTNVREDVLPGEMIIKVDAVDEDSLENGRVIYSIESGDKFHQYRIEESNGSIFLFQSVDRETLSSYNLQIKACDNGAPPLCSVVNVYITIDDINDNPPLFEKNNFSVILQENKDLGFVLLKFDIKDIDEYPNAAPYAFDIRSGNEGALFRIEQDGTLRTASKFNHAVCNSYNLQVRVFDNGTPPLFSDVWVAITIIEESQYPPIIMPLEVTVNSYEDNFSGGFLGQVHASDQDKYDTLTYNLSPTVADIFSDSQMSLFDISHHNGSLFATSYLDIGLYKVNVTVSDGKYTSSAIVHINVEIISSEMVANAVVLQFNKISPEKFILSHRKGLIRAFRSATHCRQKDIIIVTMQSVNRRVKTQNWTDNFNDAIRNKENNLDVVIAVKKPEFKSNIENFFTSHELQKVVSDHLVEIEENTNLILDDILPLKCKQNNCKNGNCVARLYLDKTKIATFFTDVVSFVTPIYYHAYECNCKQGFHGKLCDEPMNACSSQPCPPKKICLAATTTQGFQCMCAEGYTGQFCEIKVIKRQNEAFNNHTTFVSFRGKSFAHYQINKTVAKKSIEERFKYSLKIRTRQLSGTLLYASGKIDYNILEVKNGAIQYKFDLGSGESTVVVSSVFISDGEWHTILLERVFNSAKLIIDSKHVSQGSTPGVNGILNLKSNDIFVGAEVKPNPSIHGFEDVQRGFIGCMADIRIDLEQLPLHVSSGSSIAVLKRLTNVGITCDDSNVLVNLGICGSQPCLNGGTCTDIGEGQFKCACSKYYDGDLCELNLDPCASAPCLFGGRCEQTGKGNFTCTCPLNLQGKRCEFGKFCTPNPCKNGGICEEGDGMPHCMCRGYTGLMCEIDVNECENQPCGSGATCINEAGSFRCICPSYLTGASCGDPLYSNSISTKLKNFSMDHMTAIIFGATIIFTIITLILCLFLLRTKKSNVPPPNKLKHTCKEENLNSLIDKDKMVKHNQKMSNLEINKCSISYSPTAIENIFPCHTTIINNLDILRNYGSAGDELESVPLEYQKVHHSNQKININYRLSSSESMHKDWVEQKCLKTFSENKLNTGNEDNINSHLNQLASLKSNCGRLVQVAVPNVCYSTSSKTAEDSSVNEDLYHWDCSDWVRRSHNPLPDITEVPGAEIPDSSSFVSNESNESKPKYEGQITCDLHPFQADYLTSEYIDSEVESRIKPLEPPLLKSGCLSRLSLFNKSDIEDYKINTENPEERCMLGNRRANIGSNSDISVHLCEIEDSELEEFLPSCIRNLSK